MESGIINTGASETLPKRLLTLYEQIEVIVKRFPEICMIGTESLFVNGFKVGGRNKSAAIVATNMVTGYLMLLAEKNDIAVKQYTPGSVKKMITGAGDASKNSVEEVLSHLINKNNIEIIASHQSDAIAIAWTTAIEVKKYGLLETKQMASAPKQTKTKKYKVIKTKEFRIAFERVDGLIDKTCHYPFIELMANQEKFSNLKEHAINGRFKKNPLALYRHSLPSEAIIGYTVGLKYAGDVRTIKDSVWYSCEIPCCDDKAIHRHFSYLLKKLERHPKLKLKTGGMALETISTKDGGEKILVIAVEVDEK